MASILMILFCFFSLIVLYVYIGYPVVLPIFSSWFKKSMDKGQIEPMVSIIIAAYNEEKIIDEKIKNTLRLDYPRDKLQIIVASDGSTDRTNAIVENYEGDGIILHARPKRNGKTMTLNHAVQQANGEILIFTDATAMLQKDCIKTAVRNFHDANVGCVCPNMTYKNVADNHITRIEGLYWKYESFLKEKESELGSLAFVPGACFAMRKKLFRPVAPEYDHDCISPLDVISQGYRIVYDEKARFHETVVSSSSHLFQSKVRMITKDFAGTLGRNGLLNPFTYGWVALTLLSHKLLRWMIPFFLIDIFICNVRLIYIELFQFILLGQIIFYSSALFGLVSKGKRGCLSIPFYFCIVNLAAFVEVSKAVMGKKIPIWQPIR